MAVTCDAEKNGLACVWILQQSFHSRLCAIVHRYDLILPPLWVKLAGGMEMAVGLYAQLG
jgi:hypothetical protein